MEPLAIFQLIDDYATDKEIPYFMAESYLKPIFCSAEWIEYLLFMSHTR